MERKHLSNSTNMKNETLSIRVNDLLFRLPAIDWIYMYERTDSSSTEDVELFDKGCDPKNPFYLCQAGESVVLSPAEVTVGQKHVRIILSDVSGSPNVCQRFLFFVTNIGDENKCTLSIRNPKVTYDLDEKVQVSERFLKIFPELKSDPHSSPV